MRLRPEALALAALAATVLLTACDNFADYTVINETDEELITWPLLEDCAIVVGNKQDYLPEESVQPRERHDYSDAYWGLDPQCVQVATKDRRLVLAEQYESGGVYIVQGPLHPVGKPIPERSDLPGQSFGEFLRETPSFVYVYIATGLASLVGFLFAVFITARFFYRYYVSKSWQ